MEETKEGLTLTTDDGEYIVRDNEKELTWYERLARDAKATFASKSIVGCGQWVLIDNSGKLNFSKLADERPPERRIRDLAKIRDYTVQYDRSDIKALWKAHRAVAGRSNPYLYFSVVNAEFGTDAKGLQAPVLIMNGDPSSSIGAVMKRVLGGRAKEQLSVSWGSLRMHVVINDYERKLTWILAPMLGGGR